MTIKISMPLRFLVAGGLLALALPAHASGWSDGSSFNTPKGAESADFNAPAGGYGRDENGNRTIVDGRFVGACYFYKDGLTPGVGSRSGVAEASGFPPDPCKSHGMTPAVQNQAIGNNVTVVTQGSRNTVIVNTRQTNNGNQKVELNGTLKLN